MNGHDDNTLVARSHANETAARVVAYLSPYLFWGTVAVIAGGIMLIG